MILSLSMVAAPAGLDSHLLHRGGGCASATAQQTQPGSCGGRSAPQSYGCAGTATTRFSKTVTHERTRTKIAAVGPVASIPAPVVAAPALRPETVPDPKKYEPGPVVPATVTVIPVATLPLPMTEANVYGPRPILAPVRESFGFFTDRARGLFRGIKGSVCPKGGCR